MDDPFDLARFVEAQAPCLADVERELAAGKKQTHWMWFVFPQLRGLGTSALATRYGISSLDEAVAYLAHPTLGGRLHHHTELVLAAGRTAAEIFGPPDDLKLRSCLTLFARTPNASLFQRALDQLFAGTPDAKTVALLQT